jgi:hypothetical protein
MSRRSVFVAGALALVALSSAALGGGPGNPDPRRYVKPDLDVVQGERFEKAILAVEGSEGWRRIDWRASAEEAVAESARTGRPLFAVLTVSEFGKDHSTFT